MKFSLIGNAIANWVEATVDEIKKLLNEAGVPFLDSWTRDFSEYGTYTHQILFEWCSGDVVIGNLHPKDDDVIAGRGDLTYPSIETYGFPWDEDDITVFETPKEFVEKIKNFYTPHNADSPRTRKVLNFRKMTVVIPMEDSETLEEVQERLVDAVESAGSRFTEFCVEMEEEEVEPDDQSI